MAELTIQSLVLGMVGTNCYFLLNPDTKEMLLIDPADEPERIVQKISEMQGQPVAILLTHGHYDHILAAEEIRKRYEIPVYVEEMDEPVLEDARLNLSASWHIPFTMKADHPVKDQEILELAGWEIHVLHTPGHTQGSCCYYFPDQAVLFSGDTLFCQSYGRVDFPTSSPRAMQQSIQRLLSTLPDETSVYPGHEMETTIAMEKRYNPLA